jgi:hypothetical protein
MSQCLPPSFVVADKSCNLPLMPAFLERIPLQKMRFMAAAFVFTAALVLYCVTLAPTVTFVDSGELLVVSDGLGVAHPPGFPLYVLLAHFASLLPVGSVADSRSLGVGAFRRLGCGDDGHCSSRS